MRQRQQPDQRVKNRRKTPIGLQHSKKILNPEASKHDWFVIMIFLKVSFKQR